MPLLNNLKSIQQIKNLYFLGKFKAAYIEKNTRALLEA